MPRQARLDAPLDPVSRHDPGMEAGEGVISIKRN